MKSRSWLRILLIVALCLSVLANVFMLGFIAKTFRSGLGAGVFTEELVRAYPQEVRDEFRRLLRQNRSRTFAMLRELRQARRALADSAGASPYVEADVRAAMQRVRDATNDLQNLMQGVLLEALRNTRQTL